MFIDPVLQQVEYAAKLGVSVVEFHTGVYCNAVLHHPESAKNHLDMLFKAAQYAYKKGLEVHAGHGITFKTVEEISKIPLKELNIGHFLIEKQFL